MKDKYFKPEVEIEKFSMTDVITTSIPGDDNDEPSPFSNTNLFA